jgi:hypothetical protein
MNMANKRLIMAVCALAVAEVAMAALPKSSIDSDIKDPRIANIVATSPKDDTADYTCEYIWQIDFSNGSQTTDSCEAKVPAGSKNAIVCTKKYDRRISVVALTQSNCRVTHTP